MPGARLLVVDDGADNRRLLQAFLSAAGYTVDLAEDGVQAVGRARETRYQLILLDLSMPNLDGFGAARAIRSDEDRLGYARTPLVAVTALDFAGVREQCLDAGMHDYLPKPINRALLLSTVEKQILAAAGTRSHEPAIAAAGPRSTSERIVVKSETAALIPLFIESRRADLGRIPWLLGQRGFEEIHRIGQLVKGSGASYGMPGLSELGRRLEEAARQRAAPEVSRVMLEIEVYLETVEVEVRSSDPPIAIGGQRAG